MYADQEDPSRLLEEVRAYLESRGIKTGKRPVSELLDMARTDPVLCQKITPQERDLCRERGRLTAALLLGNEEDLSMEEAVLIHQLCCSNLDQCPKPANIRTFLHIPLGSPLCALEHIEEVQQTSEAQKAWIIEYTVQYGTFFSWELEVEEEKVQKCFHDGLPFTMSRYFAAEAVLEDTLAGAPIPGLLIH